MQVSYPDPHPVPGEAPESLQILNTAQGMAEAGGQIRLLTPAPPTPLTPERLLGHPLHDGVRLEPLFNFKAQWWYPSGSNQPFFWLAARRLAADTPGGCLLVRNLKLADALLRRFGSDLPLFFETHELFAQSFAEHHPAPTPRQQRKLAVLAAMEQRVYANSRGLVALTHCLEADLRARYQVTTPCLVAPDGVDAQWLGQPPLTRPASPTGPLNLLYLGTLHTWKGVETLLQALPAVTGASLSIAGGPPARQQALTRLAGQLGILERVRFLGHVPPGERQAVMAGADICLLPLTHSSLGSRYTSPLKLFEYLAMGKAVVAADLPAIREVLSDGVDALLAPPEEPPALAQAIQRLVDDPELRRRLGARAALRAQDFTWARRGANLLHFLANAGGINRRCGSTP